MAQLLFPESTSQHVSRPSYSMQSRKVTLSFWAVWAQNFRGFSWALLGMVTICVMSPVCSLMVWMKSSVSSTSTVLSRVIQCSQITLLSRRFPVAGSKEPWLPREANPLKYWRGLSSIRSTNLRRLLQTITQSVYSIQMCSKEEAMDSTVNPSRTSRQVGSFSLIPSPTSLKHSSLPASLRVTIKMRGFLTSRSSTWARLNIASSEPPSSNKTASSSFFCPVAPTTGLFMKGTFNRNLSVRMNVFVKCLLKSNSVEQLLCRFRASVSASFVYEDLREKKEFKILSSLTIMISPAVTQDSIFSLGSNSQTSRREPSAGLMNPKTPRSALKKSLSLMMKKRSVIVPIRYWVPISSFFSSSSAAAIEAHRSSRKRRVLIRYNTIPLSPLKPNRGYADFCNRVSKDHPPSDHRWYLEAAFSGFCGLRIDFQDLPCASLAKYSDQKYCSLLLFFSTRLLDVPRLFELNSSPCLCLLPLLSGFFSIDGWGA